MYPIRTALLSCLTALTCVAMLLAYAHKFLRYEIIGNDNAVFVLDRQTTLMHRCDKEHCTLITPQGTTIESMRQLAGIPSPQDMLKKVADQNTKSCNCTNIGEQLFPHPKMELTSFQSVDLTSSASLSPDMVKQNQASTAKNLGMSSMMNPNAAPVNPFPGDTSSGTSGANSSSFSSSGSANSPSVSSFSNNSSNSSLSSNSGSLSPSGGNSYSPSPSDSGNSPSSPSSPSDSGSPSSSSNSMPSPSSPSDSGSPSSSSPSPSDGSNSNNGGGMYGNSPSSPSDSASPSYTPPLTSA